MSKFIPSLVALASLLFCMVWTPTAQAEEKPINVALFDPIQIFDNSHDIKGLRLNVLYGYNKNLKGVDFGFVVNRLDGDLTGAQFGLFNWTNNGKVTGAQLGTVNFHSGLALGAQLGLVNYAKEVTGLQWGFVNYAERLNKGLQLGLINIAKNGFLPVFVIVNFNFD